MKTTLFLFCISILILSCSKDRDIDKMGVGRTDFIFFCGTSSVRAQEIDTTAPCTTVQNNLYMRGYEKFQSQEQLEHCRSLPPANLTPCSSQLGFIQNDTVGYSEASVGYAKYSYQIEGDSVKLYNNSNVNINSFFIDLNCEQRLIERDGDRWFLQ